MKYAIAIQNTVKNASDPIEKKLRAWARAALKKHIDSAEICIRIVDEAESKNLNQHYRKKSYPTNVLSFPCEQLTGVTLEQPYIGDIVVCSSVVEREAIQQHKVLDAHWAHMIIHGVLHLLGYDHIKEAQAKEMEAIEITLLHQFGYENPYGEHA